MATADNLERLQINSPDELHRWLLEHHDQEDGVWLVTFKKRHADRYVSRDQVLDELVSFGWTDGVRRKLDEDRTMQLISPRRVQYWAKTYKDRAAALIAAGRMHEAGLRSIEQSKEAGLWDFMEDVDALVVPDDLDAALAAHPPARSNFHAFPDSTKRNTLRWIKLAKTAGTRTKRVEETARRAARKERVPNA